MQKTYKNADDFRKALESRINAYAKKSGSDVPRVRRSIAFNRFLARIFSDQASPWVLKGGYAMELRLARARTTRDIDLTFNGIPKFTDADHTGYIQRILANAAAVDLHDYFSFRVGGVQMELAGPVYGGARYSVEVMMAGRLFVSFHVDAAVGDYIPEDLETAHEDDLLSFAGITPATFPMIPREVQFAEKLHAYTLPRDVPNSRARDLVDMVLLIQEGKLTTDKTEATLTAVFNRRKTHEIPIRLEPAPDSWETKFAELAEECGLNMNLQSGFELLNRFYCELRGLRTD